MAAWISLALLIAGCGAPIAGERKRSVKNETSAKLVRGSPMYRALAQCPVECYAWDAKSGNVVRYHLYGKKRETVIQCGFKSPNPKLVFIRDTPYGGDSQTKLVLVGLPGKTVAYLNYTNARADHPALCSYVSKDNEVYAWKPGTHVVTTVVKDLTSGEPTPWKLELTWKRTQKEQRQPADELTSVVLTDGSKRVVFPAGWRFYGLVQPTYALVFNGHEFAVWDFDSDIRIKLFDAYAVALWPNRDDDEETPVEIRTLVKGSIGASWFMKNPLDFRMKDSYLPRKAGSVNQEFTYFLERAKGHYSIL